MITFTNGYGEGRKQGYRGEGGRAIGEGGRTIGG